MSSLMIRAEDWDQMAQSGRAGSPPSGRSVAVRPVPDGLTAGPPAAQDRVAELLAALLRAREVEQQLRTCIEQLQVALQQAQPGPAACPPAVAVGRSAAQRSAALAVTLRR